MHKACYLPSVLVVNVKIKYCLNKKNTKPNITLSLKGDVVISTSLVLNLHISFILAF